MDEDKARRRITKLYKAACERLELAPTPLPRFRNVMRDTDHALPQETPNVPDETQYWNGVSIGTRWAGNGAKSVELQWLSDFRDLFEKPEWDNLFVTKDWPADEVLFNRIAPDKDENREARIEFWRNITGASQVPSADFIHGFADAALAVWRDRIGPASAA
jgi:hypothetical protein